MPVKQGRAHNLHARRKGQGKFRARQCLGTYSSRASLHNLFASMPPARAQTQLLCVPNFCMVQTSKRSLCFACHASTQPLHTALFRCSNSSCCYPLRLAKTLLLFRAMFRTFQTCCCTPVCLCAAGAFWIFNARPTRIRNCSLRVFCWQLPPSLLSPHCTYGRHCMLLRRINFAVAPCVCVLSLVSATKEVFGY